MQAGGKVAVENKIGSLRGLFVLEVGRKTQKLRIKSNVIIVEKNGGFDVTSENKEKFKYDDIKKQLNSILGRETPAQLVEKEKIILPSTRAGLAKNIKIH